MEEYWKYIPIVLVGYLVGSFPTAYLLVKYFAHKNILALGTANVGTLNVLRATNSKVMTGINLVGDITKGIAALVLGYMLASLVNVPESAAAATAGIASVIGHNYTIFLKFQGGKGLATGLPVLFYLNPLLVPIWLVTFFVTVAVTRLLVLGQIVGTLITPLMAVLLLPQLGTWSYSDAIPVLILGGIVFVRHASRIKGLIKGTEPKLYYKIRETSLKTNEQGKRLS